MPGEPGRALVLHCVHRNPAVPPSFDSSMIVKDSLVHEVDGTRFLFDEEIALDPDHEARRQSGRPEGIQDLQIAIMRTDSGKHVDVELFVTTGVAYEVRTELVGEKGSAFIGLDVGLVRKGSPGTWGGTITPGFRSASAGPAISSSSAGSTLFSAAPRPETTQMARPRGTATPLPRCAAGVEALETGLPVEVKMVSRASIPGA